MKKIFIDVETTGLSTVHDRITELAALYEVDGEINSEFHVYCKPFDEKPLNYKVLENKGMPKWDFLVENGCSYDTLYKFFKKWLESFINPFDKEDKALFYGYNARFDMDFCRALFKTHNDSYFGAYFYRVPVDVMALAIEALSKKSNMPPNFKLTTVCEVFNTTLKNAHTAIEDIQATRDLYNKIA